MNVLALDIGNTRTAAALVSDGAVTDRYVPDLEQASPRPEQRAAAAFEWAASRGEPVDGVVVSSVVPTVLEVWKHLWHGQARTRRIPELIVDQRAPLPFALGMESPETVGADRFCNVAGAVALGMDTAIVVDLGTANTFDVLFAGVFLGGLIGPGAERAHRAMIDAGAQLPDLPFGYPPDLIGRNTPDAMRAGSFHQAVGSVAHVVHRLWDRHPDAPVVLTGGIAEMVGPELPFSVLYHPDLTLEGAAFVGRSAWGAA